MSSNPKSRPSKSRMTRRKKKAKQNVKLKGKKKAGNHMGRTHWRYALNMVLGGDELRTESIDIPRYASLEYIIVAVQVVGGVAEKGRIFETGIQFVGEGCLKLCIPLHIFRHAFALDGKSGETDVMGFYGVRVAIEGTHI